MGEQLQEHVLTEILKAVSDATRRSILTTLVQEGPLRVTELASRYEMSLNAISKHIKVLESAGLVTRRTHGRVHLIEADLGPARAIDVWFGQLRSIWELRLNRLGEVFSEGNIDNERPVTDGEENDSGSG